MYSKYTYSAGATAVNILADLVAILTGETNVANLSASCDKLNTSILSTIAAGWVLHDATAGTNAKCIKAPLADDPNAYKFVVLDLNTAGFILQKTYEAWDATAHTGTNLCNLSATTTAAQQFSTSVTGTVHIFATARFVLIFSTVSAAWGSSSNAGASGCVERTRVCPWDTPVAGWPPFAYTNLGDMATNSGGTYPPRILTKVGTTLLTTQTLMTANAGTQGAVHTMMSTFASIDQKVPDGSGGSVIPFFPIAWMNTGNMPAPYGEISSLCGIFALPANIATNLDVIVKDGLDFICLQAAGSTKMFAVRKG
ncbi:MAG: hypothetical protein HQL07_00385 [Nitrospirae bacterium]|nr:hypothetical protein [Magnetococcales bacterium]